MVSLVVFFVLIISFHTQSLADDDSQLNVHERVALLKKQIMEEISRNQKSIQTGHILRDASGNERSGEITDNYDYENIDDKPITPINDNDERKLKDKFKHRPIVTVKPTTPFVASAEKEPVVVKPLRSKKKKKKPHAGVSFHNPRDIFYRRGEGLDPSRNTPLKGIHCLDLLTPFLSDTEWNGTIKFVTHTDTIVLRLIQLISEHTIDDTKDEIYSILYQISNVPIRLFQWDDKAIKLLFNQIIQDKVQNFKTLKRGVKKMFRNWHLDIGNVTNLLRQTRIFRPPCIQTSVLSGSTKTSKSIRYTKPRVPKKSCPPSAEEDDDDDC